MLEARLIVVIGWLVVAAVGGILATLRAKRGHEIADIAARAGLQFSNSDPFECTRVNFQLFRKGDGRSAENVMWRDADDGHVYRALDFAFYDEHKDRYG